MCSVGHVAVHALLYHRNNIFARNLILDQSTFGLQLTYIVTRTGRIPWKIATDQDEYFRDYIADRMVEKGYFFVEEICNIASRRVIYSLLDMDYVRWPLSAKTLDSRWLQETKICTAAESRPL
ncbi:unnamed protein product [Penicillium salamii]|uniref:Uncharacterized protein n=1 Tax=Penicillium salamii TaxID=1612424 RepID=A0A9W4IXM3_9EURO|nr:unnamed protein product [Penicillium salamii]CAG7972159.1 unnamed protein product [Penicillium salamii]CAG7978223.1 unnamed protein product [Penicillium salamii]CAG7997644.1 unnamed protein product [Penicillium salamii]CAG7998728.1 unnamed protein product [Penicillium salamii]